MFPFEFDQAIGKLTVKHQGTCRLKVGNGMLNLYDSLYSPNYACNIISAVKLKNNHGIVAAAVSQLHVKIKDDQPIAKRVAIDEVLYVRPLESIKIPLLR